MKNTFKQHKPFFIFLLKFVLFYLIFTLIYKFYLNQFNASKNEIDGITNFVAQQTRNTLLFFGKDCEMPKHELEASFKILYYHKYLARIVEGCNAISVIILFASFVFAFSGKWITTFLYIFLGSGLVFVLNILRIALLTMGLYSYPEYEGLLHDIVFPIIVYGIVFVLWVLWVLKFSSYAKRKN